MVLETSEYNDDHDGESSSRIINLGTFVSSRLLKSYDLYGAFSLTINVLL